MIPGRGLDFLRLWFEVYVMLARGGTPGLVYVISYLTLPSCIVAK
jgi:hypothetical protein